jgi:hypothetical protein
VQVTKKTSQKVQARRSSIKVSRALAAHRALALLAGSTPALTPHPSRCLAFLQTFVKAVNYQHLMPTRYTLEVELKGVVAPDALDNSTKRKEACVEAKKLLEEKFKSGKNRWFFTKLRF